MVFDYFFFGLFSLVILLLSFALVKIFHFFNVSIIRFVKFIVSNGGGVAKNQNNKVKKKLYIGLNYFGGHSIFTIGHFWLLNFFVYKLIIEFLKIITNDNSKCVNRYIN